MFRILFQGYGKRTDFVQYFQDRHRIRDVQGYPKLAGVLLKPDNKGSSPVVVCYAVVWKIDQLMVLATPFCNMVHGELDDMVR